MNHYQWLEENFFTFYKKVCEANNMVSIYNNLIVGEDGSGGIITAHGDKCEQYKRQWEENGIHFFHGAACYLLTYLVPWQGEVREQGQGASFVKPGTWVIENYDERFRPYLPMVMPVSLDYSNKNRPKAVAPTERKGLKIQWVSLYYPIGKWVDESGKDVPSMADYHYFRAMCNGEEIACTMVEVSEHGTHGESTMKGLIPQFFSVATSKRIQIKDGDFIELL